MEKEVVVENKSTKEKVLKIAKIAGNSVFYAVIVLLLLFSIMNIRGTKNADSYPNIFGRGMLAVVTDSMDGDLEDSFQAGDLIVVKTFKEKNFNDLEIGDVVTYYDEDANDGKGGLNSHRIVHVIYDKDGNLDTVVVQGDQSRLPNHYNCVYDPTKPQQAQTLIKDGVVDFLTASDILGVMIKVKEGAGSTLLSVQKNWFIIFVVPVLIFLLVEVFIVVKNIMDLKNEKNKEELKKANEELKADLEAQKEALRAEILEELKKEKEETDKDE